MAVPNGAFLMGGDPITTYHVDPSWEFILQAGKSQLATLEAILKGHDWSTYPPPGHVPPPGIAGVPYDQGLA